MAHDTERQSTERQSAEDQNDEMRAINEKLVIAAVRHQEAAEAALKNGELYRLLARNFPNGMVLLFDHDLRHSLAGGQGLRALGLSKERLEGRTLWEEFAPQTCRELEPAYRAALAGETTVREVLIPVEKSWEDQRERVYRVHALPVMDDQGNILLGMAVAQDVTEQRQAEETIRWQAHHDALTGLPNRTLLRDRLDQVLALSRRSGESAALLFLDLNHFKHINDTLGHDAGDSLLQAVARRLTSCLRAEDTVARLGGDEFVVLLPGLQATGDAGKVAQKILLSLAEPTWIEGHEISVTASIGISLFPHDGRDAAALMKRADAAMYQSKQDHYTGLRPFVDAGSAEAGESSTSKS